MKHVLIIEDDDWLAESYGSTLKARGYLVECARSAEEGIDHIDARIPDVIVADVVLGDTNILALLHELQSYRDTAAIPVILCTSLGLDPEQHRQSFAPYGVHEILDKAEITPDRLSEAIERALHEAKNE